MKNKYYMRNTEFNDKTALILEQGQRISYGELEEETERLFSNIKEKSIVLFLCTNSYECVAGYISCLKKHLVPIMISAQTGIELIQSMVHYYRPRYIYCPVCAKPEELQEQYIQVNNFKEYQLLEICEDDRIEYEINKNLALLLTTSGSTGSQKLVRLSYRNLEANTDSIIKYLNLCDRDCGITMLPMHYTYGLSIINTHLKVGAAIVLNTKNVVNIGFWNSVELNHVNSLSGVPYTYEILQKIRFHTMNLKSLQYLTVAGGKLTDSQQEYLAEYARERKLKLYIMYGQTEATARIAYLPPEYAGIKIGSTGIPVPGGRIEIEPNTKEIIYYGDNVSMGYAYSYADLSKGDDNKGILHTGDIGYLDNEGYLYVTGRKDRYVKIFGHRMDLNTVEDWMKKTFHKESVCRASGNNLIIYVNCENVDEINIKKISDYLNINSKCIEIKSYRELPRNEYGKITFG